MVKVLQGKIQKETMRIRAMGKRSERNQNKLPIITGK